MLTGSSKRTRITNLARGNASKAAEFRAAVESKNLEEVNRLLSETSNLESLCADADYNYALCFLAGEGCMREVINLLRIPSVQASITSVDNQAFRWAASNGHEDIVNYLLKNDSVRKLAGIRNNCAFISAAGGGYTSITKKLLSLTEVTEDPSFKEAGFLALRDAAAHGHLDTVILLLEHPLISQQIVNDDFVVLRWADAANHQHILNHLMQIQEVREAVLKGRNISENLLEHAKVLNQTWIDLLNKLRDINLPTVDSNSDKKDEAIENSNSFGSPAQEIIFSNTGNEKGKEEEIVESIQEKKKTKNKRKRQNEEQQGLSKKARKTAVNVEEDKMELVDDDAEQPPKRTCVIS